MRPIALAMARDYWFRGNIYLVSTLVIALGWMLLTHGLLTSDAIRINEGFTFYMSIWMELVGLMQLVFVASAFNEKRSGFPSRLYTLPATTPQLVAIQMAIAGLAVILLHLLVACGFRWLVGVWPPLLEPALFLVAAQACVLAIVWSLPDFNVLRLLIGIVVAVPLCMWVSATYGYRSKVHLLVQNAQSLGPVWDPPSAWNILWMLALTAAACGIAVAGVARDRRGDALGTTVIHDLGRRLLDHSPERRRPFASPATAQFWMEWHGKGWLLPGGMVFGILGFTVWRVLAPGFSSIGYGNDFYLEALLGLAFFLPLAGAYVIGLFLGVNFNSTKKELDAFRATRPLNDRSLAHAVFKAGAASVLIAWIIGFVALLIAGGAVALFGQAQVVSSGIAAWNEAFGFSSVGWLWLPSLAIADLLVAWTLLAWISALGLTGHGRLMGTVMMGIVAVSFLAILSYSQFSSETMRIFENAGLTLLAPVLPLGTAAAFVLARRRRLIGPSLGRTGLTICALLLIAVAVCPIFSGIWPALRHLGSLRFTACLIGALALPLTPLALGPLAIARNRHR